MEDITMTGIVNLNGEEYNLKDIDGTDLGMDGEIHYWLNKLLSSYEGREIELFISIRERG